MRGLKTGHAFRFLSIGRFLGICLALVAGAAACSAIAQTAPGGAASDLPGSRDPNGFKRFSGSKIITYATRSFDQYALARGNGAPPDGFEKSEKVEGQIARMVYQIPPEHTALEVLRNYEDMLKGIGLERNFEIAPCNPSGIRWTGYFLNAFYHQAGNSDEEANPLHQAGDSCYFTARGTRDGQVLDVAVFITTTNADWSFVRGREPRRVLVPMGTVLAAVDVVVAKAVQMQMVEVKATDMAEALATKGAVEIYGILFDTDKADIKPESDKTLDEIATLLKIDRALKLEISGHTDNTGSADHNQKLSEARAAAVVQTLTTRYGIAANRLTAKGFGDTRPVAENTTEAGKAKNRRVELRKM
jgi:outer membrane protein OmpA-like peptidoglycan-associated protein